MLHGVGSGGGHHVTLPPGGGHGHGHLVGVGGGYGLTPGPGENIISGVSLQVVTTFISLYFFPPHISPSEITQTVKSSPGKRLGSGKHTHTHTASPFLSFCV